MLTVAIYDQNKIQLQTTTRFTVERYDAYADGGPYRATITAQDAPEALDAIRRWLGYYLVIYNSNGRPVWWGKITGADTPYGKLTIGAHLTNLYNRVRILYTKVSGSMLINLASEWLQDVRSMEAYGVKELQHSLAEASDAQATAAGKTILAQMAKVRQPVSLGSGESIATISCEGLWSLMEWTYYEDQNGRALYDGLATTEIPIGWGVTASDIGFTDRMIHKLTSDLGELRADDVIRVTGSYSNNGTFVVSSGATKLETYTATTISFEAADDIFDSAEGFGFIRNGSYIRIVGSASNSGYHLIDSVARNNVTTASSIGGAIVAEAAGPSITINQAATLGVTVDVTPELPGYPVTLSGLSLVRTRFALPAAGTWTVAEVWVKAGKIGTPSDALSIAIYTDSGGAPGALIESGTVSSALIQADTDWVAASFSNTVSLTSGGYYWLVVGRTGAASLDNYYLVGLDEAWPGSSYVWDGAAWTSREGTVPYQIWGTTSTDAQIQRILETEGQFLEGYDLRVTTSVQRRQWRDGSRTALAELTDLLATGTAAGKALFGTITPEWRCIVDQLPEAGIPPYRLTRNGDFRTAGGAPLEEGFLPVGQWCEVDGLNTDGDDLTAVSPFLMGYMEYDNGISNFSPYGASSVWDIETILQG